MIRYLLLAILLPLSFLGTVYAASDFALDDNRIHLWADSTQTWVEIRDSEGDIRGNFFVNDDNQGGGIEVCDNCAFGPWRFTAWYAGQYGGLYLADENGVIQFSVDYGSGELIITAPGLPPSDPGNPGQFWDGAGVLRVSQ